MIYLDNAATSWPKPEAVYDAVIDCMKNKGGNPGRSGHKFSISAGQVLDRARFSVAKLFKIRDPKQIVFSLNATDALNLAINGVLIPGDHVITSSMEHNSVIRPLEHQVLRGVKYTKVYMDPIKGVDIEELKRSITPKTKMVVMTHSSNVIGTINPIKEIGEICKNENIIFLVDAAQTAGSVPIDVDKMGIDLLAFPGHKGLLGPLGAGGIYIKKGIELTPARYGGTGIYSEMKTQPDELPFRYESGTQNVPGLAGLYTGVEYVLNKTVESICKYEQNLTEMLMKELSVIDEVIVYGYPCEGTRTSAVSFNIKNMDCIEVAMILDTSFDIAVRAGLHCAPDAHIALGTMKLGGTIRVSAGIFNTEDDIMGLVSAIKEIIADN